MYVFHPVLSAMKSLTKSLTKPNTYPALGTSTCLSFTSLRFLPLEEPVLSHDAPLVLSLRLRLYIASSSGLVKRPWISWVVHVVRQLRNARAIAFKDEGCAGRETGD